MNTGVWILYSAIYKKIDNSTYFLILNVQELQLVEMCGFVVYLTAQTLTEENPYRFLLIFCANEFLTQLKT